MPVQMSARADLRKQRQSVELDGSIYLLDLTWRQRPRGWYMDLYTREGDPIALGRRLSPRWSPTSEATDPNLPPGAFLVSGSDDYERSDLGDSLRLYYLRADELDAFFGDSTAARETVAV